MSYTINTDEPVLIYGGGPFGVDCANRMIAAGYAVAGIMDINPNDVKHSPVPVFLPTSAGVRYTEMLVWICLANGEPQTKIARELSSLGFKRILFLPLYLDSKAAKQMIAAYNAFFVGNYAVRIPRYDELWRVKTKDYILVENSGFVTARIHKNHIYTTEAVFDETTDNPYSLHKTLNNPYTSDMPYVPNVPLYELNDFYMKRFQKIRFGLYKFLEDALYGNPDYFTDCPCVCALNKNGCWDLIDGNHRAAFLLIKGFVTIPARVRRDEYARYFREDAAQELMNYCKDVGSLPFVVEHPAFSRFPVDCGGTSVARFSERVTSLFGGS